MYSVCTNLVFEMGRVREGMAVEVKGREELKRSKGGKRARERGERGKEVDSTVLSTSLPLSPRSLALFPPFDLFNSSRAASGGPDGLPLGSATHFHSVAIATQPVHRLQIRTIVHN